MNKELLDLAGRILNLAGKAGAEAGKVNLTADRSIEVSYRDRQPETIKEASTRQVNIDFYVQGRFSSQSTSDLRPEALEKFISQAAAATRLLSEDPARSLPAPDYYRGRAAIDLEMLDPSYRDYSPENRHQAVRAIEEGCLQKGGDRTVSVTAQVRDGYQEELMLTSNGFSGYQEGSYYVYGAQMTARDEGDRRPNGSDFAVAVHRRDLPAPEEIGRQAAENTLAMLGAGKLKTETLPVIIQNRNVSRFFGGMLNAMIGRNIQQKQSFLHDRKGKQIAAERLTLIDDPLIRRGLASHLFDRDGFAARKRTIIREGVLEDFFIDWYYSRKLECEPTTGRPSNLVIPPGRRGLQEIMKDLGRGVLITGFIGGNSNPTTGDASIGIIGHLFENGELSRALAEMNIADNHLQFWHRLVEAADDPWIYSAQRFPSLVFSDVVVSGM